MKNTLGAIAVTWMAFASSTHAQTSLYQPCEPDYSVESVRPTQQTIEAYRIGGEQYNQRPYAQQQYNLPQTDLSVVVARPVHQSTLQPPRSVVQYGGSCCASRSANSNGLIPGGGTADIAPSLRPTTPYQYPVNPSVYRSPAYQTPVAQPRLYRAPPAGYYQQQKTYYPPRGAQLSRGIYGQPTVYVPGQPIRNFWRYWTP